VLKVKAGAPAGEVKEAYRKAAIESHPDRHPVEQKREATKKFQRCSEAFAVLQNHPDHQHTDGSSRATPSSNEAGKNGTHQTSRGCVDAESLFRTTFGGLSDAQVIKAVVGNQVGAITGMGMLSLRRFRRQASSQDGANASRAAAASVAFAWKSSKGTDDNRWPWRPPTVR
jgi:DnaJ-class molecular chaperone